MAVAVTCEVGCLSVALSEVTTEVDRLEEEVTSEAVGVTSPVVSNEEVLTWVAVAEATETQWASKTKNETTCSHDGTTRQTKNEEGARSRLSSVQQTQCDDLTTLNHKKAAALNPSNKVRR